MKNKHIAAIVSALLAATFYAISIPFSKILLNNIAPTFLASFLYLGAGIGIGILYLFCTKDNVQRKRLSKNDLPYALGMIVLDIAAPILLMIGISFSTSSSASLLSNFEIVATSIIALLFFKEKITKRLWFAIMLITLSGILLSFNGSGSLKFSMGSVFVIGATACWGLENNCTRMISSKSTHEIVILKGIFSGLGAFLIALFIKEKIPELKYAILAMLLGFVAYGLSIFLYVRAQSVLGAAKTGAYYAVAPFIGALLSFLLLRESISISYILALIIMITGAALVVVDTLIRNHAHMHRHSFTHSHDGTTHIHTVEHRHNHNHYVAKNSHGHKHMTDELETKLPHSDK